MTVEANIIERPGFCGVYLNGPPLLWRASCQSLSAAAQHALMPWSNAEESYVNKGHVIQNNWIWDLGQRAQHGSAVWIWQSGNNMIIHNRVQEAPRNAVGLYGVRGGMQNDSYFGQITDFWHGLDCLTSRNNIVAFNRISCVLRDSNDGGALESWGSGRDNQWYSNCISDLDPGILDMGTRYTPLMQDDASHYLNVSSNIVHHVKESWQPGFQSAGSAVSVGSILQNNVFADSRLGFLVSLGYFIEPSANKILAQNIWANISVNASQRDLISVGGPGCFQGNPNGTLACAGAWAVCNDTVNRPGPGSLCHLCHLFKARRVHGDDKAEPA